MIFRQEWSFDRGHWHGVLPGKDISDIEKHSLTLHHRDASFKLAAYIFDKLPVKTITTDQVVSIVQRVECRVFSNDEFERFIKDLEDYLQGVSWDVRNMVLDFVLNLEKGRYAENT